MPLSGIVLMANMMVDEVIFGALPTDGLQFVLLLVATILIVGGVTFLPALSLGPIAEHFAMGAGAMF
jgi:K+-transporting ATPase ATPase A chain